MEGIKTLKDLETLLTKSGLEVLSKDDKHIVTKDGIWTILHNYVYLDGILVKDISDVKS